MENLGLIDVNITFKIISLKCYWVKQHYDRSTDGWKLVPLHYNNPKVKIAFFYFILSCS